MTKLYQLPDLPPAPTSEVQLLVRRLVEEGDFSVVRPLLDELQGLGRDADCQNLKTVLWWLAKPRVLTDWWNTNKQYEDFCCHCVDIFWQDLFSLDGVLEMAEKQKSKSIAQTDNSPTVNVNTNSLRAHLSSWPTPTPTPNVLEDDK